MNNRIFFFLRGIPCLLLLSGVSCVSEQRVESSTPQNFSVELKAPSSNWRVQIQEIHQVGKELWVFSSLQQQQAIGLTVVTTVKDAVTAGAPKLPVRHFVRGKTWRWKNTEEITFVRNFDSLRAKLATGKLIYQRPKR